MTLSTSTRLVSYLGNGVTTSFALAARVDYATDLKVALQDATTLVVGAPLSSSLYSVSGLGEDAGVTVTYPLSGSPLSSAYRIVIWREVPYTQDIGLTNQGALFLETLETQLDRIVMQTQQLAEELERAYVFEPNQDNLDLNELMQTTIAARDAALAAQAAAEAAADYVTLTGYQQISGLKEVTGFTPTANATIALWSPTGFGTGNYQLILKKGAAASTYSLESWDGTDQYGTFNFQFGLLTYNGYETANSLGVQNYISGLNLTVNATDPSHDIDFGTGSCTDSTNTRLLVVTSGFTKRLDATWTAGTGGGGLDTGTITSDATYHAYVIYNPTTRAMDGIMSLDETTPTLPSGYTFYRRAGSFTLFGSTIFPFVQRGDKFTFKAPPTGLAFTSADTSFHDRVLPQVPTGIKVDAEIRIKAYHASTAFDVRLNSPDVDDVTPGTTPPEYADAYRYGSSNTGYATAFVTTDDAATVRCRVGTTGADIILTPISWVDTRGKS